MNSSKYLFSILAITLLLFSCKNNDNDIKKFDLLNESIKLKYAPDSRVAIYKTNIEKSNNSIILTGETNIPLALEELKQKLVSENLKIIDKINILPDSTTNNFKYAIVNNSVANIRSNPAHSAELATQALLGTELNVLKASTYFYLVQTPDKYISWVDNGGIFLMNYNDYSNWKTAPKIIYTKNFGYVYQEEDKNSLIQSDIVLGCQLKFITEEKEFYKVMYPDERIGFIKKSEAELFKNWLQNVEPSGELIEKYARTFLGSPYLWGGTSTKGLDCSGFTKTAYLMNGFIIPRDASQQFNAGEIVDKDLVFNGLKKGDLMFFGKKLTANNKQKVTHVGIWLGNGKGEFIHSAGKVRVNSVNPEAENFDKGNVNRYLGSKRFLDINDTLIINLKNSKSIINIKP